MSGFDFENERDYIATIVEQPEDDAVRLAFAQFLRAYDPKRAEFVERQVTRIQRQRESPSSDYDEPDDYEYEWLNENIASADTTLAMFVKRNAFSEPIMAYHRGLVAHVQMDPRLFVDRGARVLEMAPVRHIDFVPLPPGALDSLLACPLLGQLDSIGFVGAGLDDAAVARIADCAHLGGLLSLDLSRNALGLPSFRAIAASPYLQQLLVVEREQGPALRREITYHPGERRVVSRSGSRMRSRAIWLSDEGRQLESEFGPLPWLYRRNRVPRFDLRWARSMGRVPVTVKSSP